MREIRTSGLMSGDGKRGDADLAQATAPVLDSTQRDDRVVRVLDRITELVEQRSRVSQVGCIEALSEPTVIGASGRTLRLARPAPPIAFRARSRQAAPATPIR